MLDEIPSAGINLDPKLKIPLYKQLYKQLRKAILEKRFKGDQKMPGTRTLASALGISRNTVNLAYEQLIIEGYLKGVTGAGTFVTGELPDEVLIPKQSETPNQKDNIRKFHLHKLDDEVLFFSKKNSLQENILPFRSGIPAVSEFPFETWTKITNLVLRNMNSSYLGYGDAAGYKPLRIAIASYLRTYRAVRCNDEQVIIVNGSQQALHLICKTLLQNSSKVWMEDPGYPGARISFLSSGAKIYPVPVNEEGLDLNYAIKNYPAPEIIYTTPSHQYPLGYTMSIAKRLKLLEWANKQETWLIEDDYDSEYRYTGNPLPSVQGLDSGGCVIYAGTFSKVLFPGLRIGYVVLPSAGITEQFIAAKAITDRQSSIIEQVVLARFIEEGHFTRHIRKMRMLYKQRQDYFISEINKELEPLLKINPSGAGMHLIGWLPKNFDDADISKRAKQNMLYVNPLSYYKIKFSLPPGLILGYTAFDEKTIRNGVQKLAKSLVKK